MAIVILQLDPQAPDVAVHDVALPPSSALIGDEGFDLPIIGVSRWLTATEVSCRSGLRSAMIGV
jgi:hypothetical protein